MVATAATVPELFISYSSKDEETVRRITERLAAARISFWIDQKGIPPSESWPSAISAALRACRAGLLVLSGSALASQFVEKEYTWIVQHGKPLYVALIDDLPRDELPFLLVTIEYVDLRRDFETEIARLINQITADRVIAAASAVPSEELPEKTSDEPQWPLIPQPQHQLVGRDVLKARIEAQLEPQAVIALRGADGIGNTVLAAALAWDWTTQRKRVLWQEVGERDEKWNTLFQEIGQVFHVPYLSQIGWDDQCKKTRALLNEYEVDLLVLDDVRTQQPVTDFVRDLFKKTADPDWSLPPRCAVLLTSQQKLSVGDELEVQPLERDPARKLFRMRAGLAANAPLDARFDLLDNHPLMVEIAASMVRTGRITLGELFDRLEKVAQSGVQTRLMLHVAYEVLHDDERALLDAFGANWTNTVTLPILTAITHLSEQASAEALNNLVAYSLITRRAPGGVLEEFSMHASNREFVRARLEADPEHYHDLKLGALSAYLDFVKAYSDNYDHYKYLDVEHTNVIKAAEWAAGNGHGEEVRAFAEHLCWEPNDYLNMRGYQLYAQILLSLVHETAGQYEPGPQERCKLLMRLGTAYRELGNYDEAHDQYKKAKAIAEELGDRLLLSEILGGNAQVHHNRSDYPSALSNFDRALRLVTVRDEQGRVIDETKGASPVSDRTSEPPASANDAAYSAGVLARTSQRAWVLSYMGVTYADMGYYEVAAMCYDEALRLRRWAGDKRGLSVTLGNIGNMLCDQGYYKEALTHYEEAFSLAQEVDDRRRYGRHIGNLGNVYFHQGNYDLALVNLNLALEKHQEVGDRRRRARRLSQLGNVYRDRSSSKSDYDHALSLYQVSLDLAENLGDKHCQVYTLNGWGLMLVRMGRPATATTPSDLASARDKFEKARVLAEKIKNKRGLGYALSNLGTVFVLDDPAQESSLDQGKAYLSEGLEIAREIGNRRGEVFALIGLGNACARRPQSDEAEQAIRYYTQALKISEEMSSKRECVYALNGLGHIHIETRQVNKALVYLQQALKVATEIEFALGEAACRCALSRAWTQFRNHSAAQTELETAARIYRKLGLDHKAQKLQEGDPPGPIV